MKDWKQGIHVQPKKLIKKIGKQGQKSSAYRREQTIQFTTLIASGFDKVQIVALMELAPNEYDKLFQDLYTTVERDIAATSTPKAYAQYVVRQTAYLRNLEQLKGTIGGEDGKGLGAKLAQTYLGAIKAQSDISHRILTTGVDLGVLKKKKGGNVEIDGFDPRDADENQLGEILKRQLGEAEKIAGKKTKKKGAKIFVLKPHATGTE